MFDPLGAIILLIFAALGVSHCTLLRLPYYWDEAGYYIPAAWDFFRTGSLIPVSTVSNAHPPLPSVYLALWWKIFGFHPLVTRIAVLAVASVALAAVWRLAERLVAVRAVTLWTVALTAAYPIWFAQSSLAHADIFAAAGTLWGLACVLPGRENSPERRNACKPWTPALWFSLAALSKETAILFPLTLAVVDMAESFRAQPELRRQLRRQSAWLASCALPLAAWYGWHYLKTGFLFGNPEFLRYNAQANLDPARFLAAFVHRLLHLTAHMNLFVPVALAVAALALKQNQSSCKENCDCQVPFSSRKRHPQRSLRTLGDSDFALKPRFDLGPGQRSAIGSRACWRILILILVNLFFFSILGGALLTRYLLPIYPLELLLVVFILYSRVRLWQGLAAFSLVAFVVGLLINPWYGFAPEDNLSYARIVRQHQAGIAELNARYPGATVLTAWPMSDELTKPELGYLQEPYQVEIVANFAAAEIARASSEPEKYTAALVFSTKIDPASPPLSLGARSREADERYFGLHHDLAPEAIARALGGTLVWKQEEQGQWIGLIGFKHAVEAQLKPQETPLTVLN